MDPDRWRRIGELFERALAQPEAGRRAWLLAATDGDTDLAAQVGELLDADDRPGTGLVDRLDGGGLAPADPLLGTQLGPWRIAGRIGAGGMGVVYRAVRADGLFEQQVAVKVLRPDAVGGAPGRGLVFERRTLATLLHDGIARLFDGGSTPDGRPYIVMELVDGQPIDRHCERAGLGVVDRVRLVVAVCRAVQFAHGQLVVHRDLKPGNVLVDATGRPKLIDFGIARLLEDRSTDQVTLLAQLTPAYASPEQLRGAPPSTADDVYALGVLLYELLTGALPFAPDGGDVLAWQRAVTERTPRRPSDAARPPLARRLRGDLDRIVLMALRKEPERRYGSAAALADDLERHLAGLPVLARGDSLGYRLGRTLVRHRVAVTAGLAVAAALAIGTAAAVRGERRALEAADHAQTEAESAQELADYLVAEFLAEVEPDDTTTLQYHRDRLLQKAVTVRLQYAARPHVRANLIDALGQVADRLGLTDTAASLLGEGLTIRTEAFGVESLERSRSLLSLGRHHYHRGDFDRAATVLEQGLAIQRRTPTGPHADVARFANDLAACQRARGDLPAAEALLEEAIRLRSPHGEPSTAAAESLNNLASVRLQLGDLDGADALLERSHRMRRDILGTDHLLTVQSLANRAVVAGRRGDHDRAEQLLREATDGYRALRTAGLDGLAQVLHNRGYLANRAGRCDEAAALLGEADELLERLVPGGHPRRIDTRRELAAALAGRDGHGSPAHLDAEFALAVALADGGRNDAARDTLATLEAAATAGLPDALAARIAELRARLGD